MTVDPTTLEAIRRTDLLSLIGRDVPLRRHASTKGGEYMGACPFCNDGTDRFRVWPHDNPPGWWCRQCDRNGDAIDYIRLTQHVGFRQACELLSRSGVPQLSSDVKLAAPHTDEPEPEWQEPAQRIVRMCQDALWSITGVRAREWLHRRGLKSDTLRAWEIGFNPHSRRIDRLWVEHGITIPWGGLGRLWSVNVRRPASEPKYQCVSGSRPKGGLFGAEKLTGRRTVVVTEGEFDAVLLWQEADVDVISMGSASNPLAERWHRSLAHVNHYLIATDNDEAGETAAAYWLDLVGDKGRRLRPPAGKDVTDSWLAGIDLRQWVQGA